MKSPTIEIAKTIQAAWDEASRQKLTAFWTARRFRFHQTGDSTISAARGHMFWNLVSYDMSRLRADLRIQSPEPERIYLTLTVCTVFQQITEWNRAYWELELATCESFLQRGDLRETQWTEFRKANRRAALVWTFTMGLGGQRMPGKITEKSDV